MATKEQIDQCSRIQRLAMQISAQGKIDVHVQYWGHTDELQVWANFKGIPSPMCGWGTREHQSYLSGELSGGPYNDLDRTERELHLLLKVDADGVPL